MSSDLSAHEFGVELLGDVRVGAQPGEEGVLSIDGVEGVAFVLGHATGVGGDFSGKFDLRQASVQRRVEEERMEMRSCPGPVGRTRWTVALR